MIGRAEYPPGVPCWIDIAPPDPQAATGFYGSVFGWQFEDRTPSGAAGRYLVAQLDGQDVAAVGWLADGSARRPAWSTYVAVEDADHTTTRVLDGGGSVLVGPIDVPGAGRMAVCSDPAGAVFKVWQARGRNGAQLVNAPGTWNWSDLSTRDPEGAPAFYGAVFGWEARTVDLGFDQATMWCVPGYGDFLATIDPDLRRRQAEAAAPDGFSDAIGWMSATASDPSTDDAASSWYVTFAVDDADAVVERAASHGGRIVVPPYDAGVARIAMIEDPQGATFTVSRYQPGDDSG